MKKSKLLALMMIPMLVFVCVIALTACGSKGHTHNWGAWTATLQATETNDGLETRACTHDSTHIEMRMTYATGTAGLAFTAIDDGAGYEVRRGTVTNPNVFIPAYHRESPTAAYKPVTSIGIGAFAEYGVSALKFNLESVTFANGSNIKNINNSAFNGCINLKSVHIPASVQTINYSAFYMCRNLKSVAFANGSQLESIGSSAFDSCHALEIIYIPASVKTLDSALSNCSVLKSVIFEEGSQLNSIGAAAFASNPMLESVVIPASVTSIGTNAFFNATFTTIFYGGTSTEWDDLKNSLTGNNGNLTSLTPKYYSATTPPTNLDDFWRWVNGNPRQYA